MRFYTAALNLTLAGCAAGDSKDEPEDTGLPVTLAPEGDPGPEGHVYTTYTGQSRFQWGFYDEPDSRDCDLYWHVVGVEPVDLCPDCIWAFDLDFTFNEDASLAPEGCLDELGDEDLAWTLGLSLTYYGEPLQVVWYYVEGSYWYPLFYATWDYPNLSFERGYYEYEESDGMYYTSFWSGEAVVQ